MVLQHAVRYHKARDWICLQDQTTLTYQSLLAHCKQLEARGKQYQHTQAQGRAHLTSTTATSSNGHSIHANIQSNSKQACSRCGYSHPQSCPAFNCKCYNCQNTGRFTALCRIPHTDRQPTSPNMHSKSRGRFCSYRRSSMSPRGRQTHRSSSHNSQYISHSCSLSQDHKRRRSPIT